MFNCGCAQAGPDQIVVVWDTAEAEATAQKLEFAMLRAGAEFVQKVPIKVDVTVSDEWCK